MCKWVKKVNSEITYIFLKKNDLPTGGKWSPEITVPEGGPKPRIWAGGRRSLEITNEDRVHHVEGP